MLSGLVSEGPAQRAKHTQVPVLAAYILLRETDDEEDEGISKWVLSPTEKILKQKV